ncbi:hypothetical protein SBF1_50133 [Candidatus Desulfosporosinus infrequens]|uniref:Uncharacterized protein n=1 Tax=Candidatus Desulfosporosinus infrequens TaxID=2043169 RepID=A0A2U3LHF9_9FIRM|nr:hypothetical protein SBF1_50133 [Candidatus Desulfosporosinus infrequens]
MGFAATLDVMFLGSFFNSDNVIYAEEFTLTPPTLCIALSTTTPVPTYEAWNFNEPTTGGYARVSCPGTQANWNPNWTGGNPVSPASVSNKNAISFPVATSNWNAPVTYWGIFSTGTLIAFGQVNSTLSSTTITTGETLTFNAGQLTVTLT